MPSIDYSKWEKIHYESDSSCEQTQNLPITRSKINTANTMKKMDINRESNNKTKPTSQEEKIKQHNLISKRYKDLRKNGTSVSEAMCIARNEYEHIDHTRTNASSEVAQMIGL